MAGWAVQVVVGMAAGLLLGLAHFGGLLATTRRLRGTGSVPLLLGSLVLRLALAGAVLASLARWSPLALAAGLLGMLAIRGIATRQPLLDRWFGPASPGGAPAGSPHG